MCRIFLQKLNARGKKFDIEINTFSVILGLIFVFTGLSVSSRMWLCISEKQLPNLVKYIDINIRMYILFKLFYIHGVGAKNAQLEYYVKYSLSVEIENSGEISKNGGILIFML